jgi:hypothetical protein
VLPGCTLNNNAAGVLMPDNVSVIQFQPFYRQAPGSPILARYQSGCPQPFPFNVSILGDGNLGAHGGSGLSAVGGTIRLGELAPNSTGIGHALKLELYAHQYYFYGNSSATCYAWPAVGCDSYAASQYGGKLPYLKPGSLLAVPSAVAPTVQVTTIPGKLILQALTQYGGYLVDDTADNTGSVCMEAAVTAELQTLYGWSVDIGNPLTPSQGAPLYWDLVSIFRSLSVVINNSNSTIGGGGTPIVPLSPPICP